MAQKRHEELLDRAFEMFASSGYDATSLEAIALSLNMTKRTIYARYRDKGTLFEAAVSRAIDRWFIPVSLLRTADTGDLETTLRAFARMQLESSLSPEGIQLQRVANFEGHRFPSVYEKYDTFALEVNDLLATFLAKYRPDLAEGGTVDATYAASAFLVLVNTATRQVLLFDRPHTEDSIDKFIDRTVRLFLDGWLSR